ncbi:MAG: CAP domain-containing protein [Solirubrobacteraceae bacterium]
MRRILVLTAVTLAFSPSAAQGGSTVSAERLIRQCANRERLLAGIPPLIRAPALDASARAFAGDMSARRFFDHTDPDGNGPQERVDAFEFGWAVGENIAMGYRSVKGACRGWMNSSGHRENILDPSYTSIGTGYGRGRGGPVFVQEFGYRSESGPAG